MSLRRVHPCSSVVECLRFAQRFAPTLFGPVRVDSVYMLSRGRCGAGRARPPKLESVVVTHLAGIVLKRRVCADPEACV